MNEKHPLSKDEIIFADVVEATPSPPSATSTPQPEPDDVGPQTNTTGNLLATILDPTTLKWLMNVGGGLLVVGFVVWLWTLGVFENPVVAASILTGVNLGVLAVGVVMTKRWEGMLAGKALTLLACLILPLNLWFYDAQGLIQIAKGGHLWIPALICTMIYTAIARLLRDKTFVYTIVGGVVLTGMLFLADHAVGRIGETIAPSIMLTLVGTACIVSRNLFSKELGPFSRSNFGSAFYQSGHVSLAAGLGTLLAGRIYYRLGYEFFGNLALEGISLYWQVFPLLIVAVAGANYLYTYQLTRKKYWLFAIGLLAIWAELITLDMFRITLSTVSASLAIAANSLLFYILSWTSQRKPQTGDGLQESAILQLDWASLVGFGLWSLGTLQFTISILFHDGIYNGLFSYVHMASALTLSSLAIFTTILKTHKEQSPGLYWFQFFIGNVLGVAGILMAGTLPGIAFEWAVLLLAALPFGLQAIVAATSDKDHQTLVDYGTQTLSFSAWLTGALVWFFYSTTLQPALLSHVLLGLSALLTGLVFSVDQKNTTSLSLAGLSFNLAIWQLVSPFGLQPIHYVAISSLTGFAGLALNRFAPMDPKSKLFDVSYHAVIFSSIAIFMIGGSSLLTPEGTNNSILIITILQSIALLVCSFIAASDRRIGYALMGLLNSLCSASLLISFVDLTGFQICELGSMALGTAVLLYGHRLWHKDAPAEDMTLSLLLGSVLTVAPILVGLMGIRLDLLEASGAWRVFHELGTLIIGLLFVGTGVSLRLRVTTLFGAGTIAAYLLGLLTLVHLPDQLQCTSAYLMIGGGVFFVSAILLSLFRERLLQIPKKIEEGKGLFQVLKWR